MQGANARSALLDVAQRALERSDAVLRAWMASVLAFDDALDRCRLAGLHDAALEATAPCVRALVAAQAAAGGAAAARQESAALREEVARLSGDVGAQHAALLAADVAWEAAGDVDERQALVRRGGCCRQMMSIRTRVTPCTLQTLRCCTSSFGDFSANANACLLLLCRVATALGNCQNGITRCDRSFGRKRALVPSRTSHQTL